MKRTRNILTQIVLTIILLVIGYGIMCGIVLFLPNLDSWSNVMKVIFWVYAIYIVLKIND